MMQKNIETMLAGMIQSKVDNLTRISESGPPINPYYEKAHDRRVENAKLFLDELIEVKALLGCGVPIKIVPLSKFDKTLKTTTWSQVEFDGKFCKVAVYTSYPEGNCYLVAMAAVNAV